jgi:hypothetical protein
MQVHNLMKSVPVSLEGKTETHMEIFFYALGHVNSNCFVHVLLSPFAHFEMEKVLGALDWTAASRSREKGTSQMPMQVVFRWCKCF